MTKSSEPLVGGHAFHEMLSGIDVEHELTRLKDEIPKATSVSKRDTLIKKLKFIKGLRDTELKPEDAYVIHHMPVIPPQMRPAIPMSGNRLEFSDVNMLYKDHMLVNNSLKDLKDFLPANELHNERRDLYEGAKAIVGYGEPISPASRGRGLKGLALQIGGVGGPKKGFFQSKVIGKKQDMSGRGTITNDPMLGMNEIGVPVDMMWTMGKMHIIRDLTKKGYSLIQAQDAYEKRSDSANTSFRKIFEETPILLNRAPTLIKSNISAFMAKPIEGHTITYNPLNLKLIAGDFDGDAVSMFLPVSTDAIKEAKQNMLPQHQVYDFRKGQGVSMIQPDHEAILGAVHLSEFDSKKKVIEYNSEKEALADVKSGKISENQPIRIKDFGKT